MTRWFTIPLLVFFSSAISASAFNASTLAGPKTGERAALAAQFSVGLLNGDATEHVFHYETPDGSRRQLSRLDWDLKEIIMGGGQISARVTERLSLNAGAWLALTEGSGEMDDYDWLDFDSNDWTHYSLSEVDVTEGYIIDVNATWDFILTEKSAVRAIVGYKQNGWSWEDRGVFLLYPEYGYIPVPLNGENLINYEQEFRIPYLGIGGDIKTGALTLSAYLHWSPWVYATDRDDHIARGILFKETFSGGDMFGAGVEARYLIEQGFLQGVFLSAGIHYQKIDLIIGDMEIYDYIEDERYFEEDIAGIDNKYMVFSLAAGFNF